VEFFYDGELYIKEGRVDDYRKEAWRIELMANRGFDYAPEPEAEPTAPENENTGQDQVVASPPTRPKKVKKEAQHGNT